MTSRIVLLLVLTSALSNALPSHWEHPSNRSLKAKVENCCLVYKGSSSTKQSTNFKVREGTVPVYFPKVISAPPVNIPISRWVWINQAATEANVSPIVVLAIEWHESAGYRSNLWKKANNPGGIEYRSRRGGLRCWWRKRFAFFRTKEEGIKVHGEVLSHPRYAAARKTKDPIAQVEAIGRAGYAEYSKDWMRCVKRYVREFMAD